MKGKHGQSAAARHAIEQQSAEIATYQSAVARLTAERDELKAKLDSEQQRNRKTERELRARLDVAAAPRIDALEEIVKQRTEERDRLKREADQKRKESDAIYKRLHRHFETSHGLHKFAATEAAMDVLIPREDGKPWRISDEAVRFEGMPEEFFMALTRKRHER